MGHHVALSVVGADRLPGSGYMRAKIAQEKLIKDSKIPYTILRSTQFFEFLSGIAKSGTDGQTVRLSPVGATNFDLWLDRQANFYVTRAGVVAVGFLSIDREKFRAVFAQDVSIAASHVAFISHPTEVVKTIDERSTILLNRLNNR